MLANRLAQNLMPAERRELELALRWVVVFCDGYLSDPAQLPRGPGDVALSALERIEPGDALIVYADADPDGWQGAMSTRLTDIEAAGGTTLARARAISRELHGYRAQLAAAIDDDARAAVANRHRLDLSAIAGFLCAGQTIRNLREMRGVAPLVAIVADTRSHTDTSGSFVHVAAGAPVEGRA